MFRKIHQLCLCLEVHKHACVCKVKINPFESLCSNGFCQHSRDFSQTRRMDEGIDKGVIYFLGRPSVAQQYECLLVHPYNAVPNPSSRGKHSASVQQSQREESLMQSHHTHNKECSKSTKRDCVEPQLSHQLISILNGGNYDYSVIIVCFVWRSKNRSMCAHQMVGRTVWRESRLILQSRVLLYFYGSITTILGISQELQWWAQASLCDRASLF